jgi:hypothetical protein
VLASEGFDLSLLGTCDDVVSYISDMIRINEGDAYNELAVPPPHFPSLHPYLLICNHNYVSLDHKVIKAKRAMLEKCKRKKMCKHCSGTRVVAIKQTLPTPSLPEPALPSGLRLKSTEQPLPGPPVITGGRSPRMRKLSLKMIESNASVKKPLIKKAKDSLLLVGGDGNGGAMCKDANATTEECPHCAKDYAETAALAASLLPSSSYCCTPQGDDPRHFAICSAQAKYDYDQELKKKQKEAEEAEVAKTAENAKVSKELAKKEKMMSKKEKVVKKRKRGVGRNSDEDDQESAPPPPRKKAPPRPPKTKQKGEVT